MIYGLWINGKPILFQASGETMTGVPATTDMHFRIGGVTETMLTTLLMKLSDNNTLTLSDTINKWYPKLPNASQVTLKMLANGTSGYPDYVYNKRFLKDLEAHPFKKWTTQELINYAFEEVSVFKPGTNQHYSHTDYVILGAILSIAAHKSIDKLYETYIFNPLNMNNTRYALTADILPPVLHSFSNDRHFYEDSTFWNPSWTSSSGAVVSNLSDIGKWGNAWMNSTLLPIKDTLQLRAPDTVGKGRNTKNIYFAMGFITINGWIAQNPSFGGYSGFFAVLPKKKVVFAAFNTNKESASDENLSQKLWQQLISKQNF
jgi:D-alanyl-D-alanine carboxypeptidase